MSRRIEIDASHERHERMVTSLGTGSFGRFVHTREAGASRALVAKLVFKRLGNIAAEYSPGRCENERSPRARCLCSQRCRRSGMVVTGRACKHPAAAGVPIFRRPEPVSAVLLLTHSRRAACVQVLVSFSGTAIA